MVILKPTKRDIIFDRFFEKTSNYRYFYFEEDSTVECDIELFGYSKFACDAAYDDDEVQWNYIIKNNKILGIIALKVERNNLKIMFLEINSRLRNKGYGTEVIETLKNLKEDQNYKSIILIPKNEEIANNFYKSLGFKEGQHGELVY